MEQIAAPEVVVDLGPRHSPRPYIPQAPALEQPRFAQSLLPPHHHLGMEPMQRPLSCSLCQVQAVRS